MVSASPQDAYPPAQIARLVGEVGVCKATMPAIQTTMLGVLAGAFIAFGAMFFTLVTLVMSGSALGFGPGRLLGGVAFSLGLLLVVVGGAELFTGNNLIVMPGLNARSRRSSCCATGVSSISRISRAPLAPR
jgi:formate/nitrite transporter FocA (FNT family)